MNQLSALTNLAYLVCSLDPEAEVPRETLESLIEYAQACKERPLMQDFAQQLIVNRSQMQVETQVVATVMEGVKINLPVVIRFEGSERSAEFMPSGIQVTIAGEYVPWNNLPVSARERLRKLMAEAWQSKFGFVVQKVTPEVIDGTESAGCRRPVGAGN